MSAAQYGAAAITLIASLLTLIPRDVRSMRDDSIQPVPVDLRPDLVPAVAPALAGEQSVAASQAR